MKVATYRYALVKGVKPEQTEQVERYMPSNYSIYRVVPAGIVLRGEDSHGWTLDDYIIPRLASGLYFAEEITEHQAHALDAFRARRAWAT